MAKRLSKSEKYIIQGMHKDGFSPKEISDEVGRALNSVKTHIKGLDDTYKPTQSEEEKPLVKHEADEINARTLMISKTRDGQRKGVSIMTKAASERGDESKKKVGNAQSRIAKNAIFHPLQDE